MYCTVQTYRRRHATCPADPPSFHDATLAGNVNLLEVVYWYKHYTKFFFFFTVCSMARSGGNTAGISRVGRPESIQFQADARKTIQQRWPCSVHAVSV